MARAGKSTHSTEEDSDDAWAPPAAIRRVSVYEPKHHEGVGYSFSQVPVQPREQRERRAPSAFSPTTDSPVRRARKAKEPTTDAEGNVVTTTRPEYKRLEAKIKSQVPCKHYQKHKQIANRLRYPLAFVEAYEAQGWRNTSRDKLKPNQELVVAHRKIAVGQRAILDGLRELQAQNASDPQVPPLVMLAEVHCSRCGSTETEPDNDILLCDSQGCHRAYHQRCQTPWVMTADIPAGEEPWYCEVCLAVFECLKSINSAFSTTYEAVKDLFPELEMAEQQATKSVSKDVESTEQQLDTGNAPVQEDDDEEEDEDFVYEEESDGSEEGDSSDEQTAGEAAEGEEMAEEVPETAQDLHFLRKNDVIDPNRVVGELAAKIDPKTGELILGVVVELQPPAPGRYSRWRVDYRDDTTDLLTRKNVELAVARAARLHDDDADHEGDGDGTDATLIVNGKRKRNEVDYRQLNELMFAGKEDSEDDETFEAKDASDEEPDGEEDEEQEGDDADDADAADLPSPTTVTAAHDGADRSPDAKRSQRQRTSVDYRSMHEGVSMS
ncbi:hypothetical protein BBJ28_00003782 [Nothophytophthora sp. Chile5]|nr:hypothetical protein BBJ28_00003782 [Nothophytophthora sp. Chile5]